MRVWQIAIIVVIAGVLGWGLVGFSSDRKTLERALADLSQKTEKLRSENRELEDRLVYLNHPRNLVKELKSQFNYREEGEKLVIIVPSVVSSSASTTLP